MSKEASSSLAQIVRLQPAMLATLLLIQRAATAHRPESVRCCIIFRIFAISVAVFSAAFESFLADDAEKLHEGRELAKATEVLPKFAVHHQEIHYVYLLFSTETIAESPQQLAPLIKYVGVEERDRCNQHLQHAEKKQKIGEGLWQFRRRQLLKMRVFSCPKRSNFS